MDYPTLSDEHQAKAAELYQSIKDSNPEHDEFFAKLEDEAKTAFDVAASVPLLAVMCLGAIFSHRDNAFM